MGDIRSPKILYLKGVLFLVLGAMASGLLILESPSFKTVLLLAIAVWAFARAYYFAFYVIQHYIDDDYKYAGLWSFVRYLFQQRRRTAGRETEDDSESRREGR